MHNGAFQIHSVSLGSGDSSDRKSRLSRGIKLPNFSELRVPIWKNHSFLSGFLHFPVSAAGQKRSGNAPFGIGFLHLESLFDPLPSRRSSSKSGNEFDVSGRSRIRHSGFRGGRGIRHEATGGARMDRFHYSSRSKRAPLNPES
jgi:hypothetical protein